MESMLGRHWHQFSAAEAIELLDSHPEQGLDLLEVQQRREDFGPNTLPIRQGPGVLVRFLLQFHQPLIYMLIASGVITLALDEWVDAGVIFGVVLLNAVIGFLQEAKAVKALEALARTMTSQATVRRAGEKQTVPSVDLVPGDIVLLQSGDKVPADLRLLRTRELQVDESALTGESVPVRKLMETLPQQTTLPDRKNMAYASALVTYGQGTGIVVATGISTELGRISELIARADDLATPLTRKIAAFSSVLLYVILGLAVATFVVGVWRGESYFAMFMAAVALAVGAIPEGLPAAVTITLAIGVARMAKRRAIIRKLPAVETLGSTTVICSDKTGTLTENQMTVQEIWAGRRSYQVSGLGYAPAGRICPAEDEAKDSTAHKSLRECLLAGLLCNDSRLEQKDGRWEVQGDPTEGALLAAAAKGSVNEAELLSRWPRIDAIPFESQRQYMATLHQTEVGRARIVYVKGAVEAILPKCTAVLDLDGQQVALDPGEVQAKFEELAAKGLRVLVFARGELTPETVELTHAHIADLCFLGLQGMIDPPRAEAMAAVARCQRAGIHVKMITGDHALTASNIARQIGLTGRAGQALAPLTVITGTSLESLSDKEFIEAADRIAVFARVTPEQKLRLVRALQASGHVVAMTGDGVNDAPALQQADIGVAMGVSGTEVAKEAADMVLTDDNFATIEAAVEEGRGVFDNLTKFIVWTLPTNLGEGLVILAAVFAGVALPILPLQILWINMTTAVLLGLMLAFEPLEPGIMQRPPRAPKTPLLTGEVVGRIFLVGGVLLVAAFGLFEWAQFQGASDSEARTVAVNVFVFVELFYLFNCRSLTKSMFRIGVFSNPWVLFGSASMVGLQLLYTYLPVMNRLFGSSPIGALEWVWILAVSLLAYGLVGAEKWLRRPAE
ncbi:MAG: cation-transporting P-type ATPase [Planctomycetota bacterium]|nr:cation-transporting P-type ATPase [Planctomycetota bacterium]